MKILQLKKRTDLKRRVKVYSITQKTEDKECVTRVHKSFVYNLSNTAKISPEIEKPQVFVEKSLNTKRGIEKFNFRVKGYFYITHNRILLRVDFKHSLMIHMAWKNKIFSPKKSEILTEK